MRRSKTTTTATTYTKSQINKRNRILQNLAKAILDLKTGKNKVKNVRLRHFVGVAVKFASREYKDLVARAKKEGWYNRNGSQKTAA